MFTTKDFKVSEVNPDKLVFRFPYTEENLHTIVLVHKTIQTPVKKKFNDLLLCYECFEKINPDVAEEILRAQKFDEKCVWFNVPNEIVKMIFSFVLVEVPPLPIKHCSLLLDRLFASLLNEPNERVIPLDTEVIRYTPFDVSRDRALPSSFSEEQLSEFKKNYLVWIFMDTKNVNTDAFEIRVMYMSNDKDARE